MSKTWRLLLLMAGTFVFAVVALVMANSQDHSKMNMPDSADKDEQHGDSYKLIGAMYTAPKRYQEDDLDKRVPLSVAQWHEHVNLCQPSKGQEREMLSAHPRFGLNGSITTKEECEAAGGNMVHVYPFEKNPKDVWSLERQMPAHQD